MSLENWLSEGKLKPHITSVQEIESLFQVIERDITDAGIQQVSADRRFATAYNAALQLATVALLATGYRVVARSGHHYLTLSSIQYTLGEKALPRMHYLNICRQARNKTDYDRAGVTAEEEVAELLTEVTQFHQDVRDWLDQYYPALSQEA